MRFEDIWRRSRKKIDVGKAPPDFDARPAFIAYFLRALTRASEHLGVRFKEYEPGGAGRTAIVPIGITEEGQRIALRVSAAQHEPRRHPLVEEPYYHTEINGLPPARPDDPVEPVYIYFIKCLTPSRDPSDVLAMQMYLWQEGQFLLGDAKPSNLGIDENGFLKILDAGNFNPRRADNTNAYAERIDRAVRAILEPRFFEIARDAHVPVEADFPRVNILGGKEEDGDAFEAFKKRAEAAGLTVYHFRNFERMLSSDGMLGSEERIVLPHLLVTVDPAQKLFGGEIIRDVRPPHAIRLSRRPKKIGAEWRVERPKPQPEG